ncbi:GAF and ANTAR domain-containing protein [Actinokineospora sp.]|uniref:GAF and ANTAR domain-containing protein n=1 Tax=Actinokineospora sp. TaxID=1872133 RepID=UPI0040383100
MRDPRDGPAAVRRLRAAVIAAVRKPAGGAAAVAQVCRACVEVLPVDGASISVTGPTGARETLYASDEVIARIESVQFTLGEGPCVEAFATRRPVLVPDLTRDAAAAWPAFASEIAGQPVGAIFAFPIQHGAIGIGTMDLYRGRPGWLSEQDLATTLQVVDLAAVALLGVLSNGADGEALEAWLAPMPHRREEVHQATGMLIAEFGISAEQALDRLRGHAFTSGALIEDVAHAITSRRLRPAELDL